MNLCIDIGNTKAKMAVFNKNGLIKKWSARKASLPFLDKLIRDFPIRQSIISSTAEFNEEIRTRLREAGPFIELDSTTSLPVTLHYKTPETLGMDRIAGICGAQALYPGINVLVIDAGTCITMDMINSSGGYYGGSIHPGISMRFKSLNYYTGKLPLIKKKVHTELVGNSTENSILAGVSYAAIREIEAMMEDYKVKFGELKVIITGGDASFFVSQVKSKIFAHSNLVLSGLNEILNYNVERH